MSDTFRAVVVDKVDDRHTVNLRDLTPGDLPEHDVLVDVEYSTLNYKDGLAITGAAPICRSVPMVCGVDLAGTVAESASDAFSPGDRVLVNGYGLSESHWGGYSQKARMKSDWLVPVPDAFTTQQAMAIGTAGYTAMLCVMALQDHGVTPESGDVVVTGAAGGVGSVAVALLARAGYRVIASTGREAEHDYLRSLGAADFLARDTSVREAAADRPRELGRRRGRRRIVDAGEPARPDPLRRLRRRLRTGRRHGPSVERLSVHPAQRRSRRRGLGDGADGTAAGSVEASGR